MQLAIGLEVSREALSGREGPSEVSKGQYNLARFCGTESHTKVQRQPP